MPPPIRVPHLVSVEQALEINPAQVDEEMQALFSALTEG